MPADRIAVPVAALQADELDVRVAREQPDQLRADVAGRADDADADAAWRLRRAVAARRARARTPIGGHGRMTPRRRIVLRSRAHRAPHGRQTLAARRVRTDRRHGRMTCSDRLHGRSACRPMPDLPRAQDPRFEDVGLRHHAQEVRGGTRGSYAGRRRSVCRSRRRARAAGPTIDPRRPRSEERGDLTAILLIVAYLREARAVPLVLALHRRTAVQRPRRIPSGAIWRRDRVRGQARAPRASPSTSSRPAFAQPWEASRLVLSLIAFRPGAPAPSRLGLARVGRRASGSAGRGGLLPRLPASTASLVVPDSR